MRAVLHGDQVLGVAGGQVQVVQHDDDGAAALGVQPADQVEDVDLVGEVEVGRRLVEQQQVGALRERHRDPGALPLAAGERVDRPVGEVGHVRPGQRLGDDRLVVPRPLPQPALVRVPAAGDQVGDGEPLRGDRRLRQQAEHLGDLAGRRPGDRLPVEQHLAARRPQQPAQGAQQRRLAAAVGPDDRGERALGQLQVEVVDDDAVVVGEA